MRRVAVGVSGGIAAYKACELIRLLVSQGHDVIPLVTPAAERFVAAETFAALARRPASETLYPHLVDAELLVIAPCTANTLAKLAGGLADNTLTEAALAHRGPLLLAPAMNPRMWEHPATQANIQTLRSRGAQLIGPAEGDTAEGAHGVGRMAEAAEIAAAVEAALADGSSEHRSPEHGSPEHGSPEHGSPEHGSLAGLRVLVTAGGTREPLDAARYLGNRSSGRMGVALAAEAQRRGASVVLLAANLSVEPPAGVETISTPTAAEMLDAAVAEQAVDVALLAAAVSDYRPTAPTTDKRAKSNVPWRVELSPTADIADALGRRKQPGSLLVLFGAEIGADGLARKRTMLESKNADLVVFNDISLSGVGFDASDNEVVLISRLGERQVARAPKAQIARAVLDEVERLTIPIRESR